MSQHYTPETQINCNIFPSRFPVMKDGMKTGIHEVLGGGKGLEILRISEEPGVPPYF